MTALTRRRHRAIIDAVRDGASEHEAAQRAGVEVAALSEWADKGEQAARGKHREFYLELMQAQAGHVADLGFGPLRRIELPRNYEPHEQQQRFHATQLLTNHRIVAACCGRRGGKTRGGGAHFVAMVARDLEDKLTGRGRWLGEPHHAWERGEGKDPRPFLRYGVVAPTYALLDEPRIALRDSFGRLEEGGIIVHQTDKIWWLVGGIRLDFLSGDHPERLVSHGYDGVWYDEAARLKAAVWVDNMRPTLSDTRGWALFTTTPLGKNWFWREIWARGDDVAAAEVSELEDKPVDEVLDDEYACVNWTTADNTAVPHLAEEMEIARRQMPEALFNRNYKADFSSFEGQCFDLVASRHRSKVTYTVHALRKVYAGLDLGMTHRSAFVVVGQDHQKAWHELGTKSAPNILPHSDNAWARRELGDASVWTTIAYRMLVDLVGQRAWTRVPVYLPADRPDVKRHFRDCGFYVLEAYQLHEPAVSWAQIAFHNGMLDISSTAMWRCLTNLRYPGEGERSTKLWVDADDDEWDALRYALSDPIKNGEFAMPNRLKSWMAR